MAAEFPANKNISKYAVDLLNIKQITLNKNPNFTPEEVLQNLHKQSQIWACELTDIIMDFFREGNITITKKYRKNWDKVPEWFDEMIDATEEAKGVEKNLKRHLPYIDDQEELKIRRSRFEWYISEAYYGGETINWGDYFDPVSHILNNDYRQLFMNLKRTNHLYTDESNAKLKETLKKIVSEENFESTVVDLTFLGLIINCFRKSFTDSEYKKKIFEKFENWRSEFNKKLSDGGLNSHHLAVIKRLEKLQWGPKNYKRKPEIIDTARAQLETSGVLALRGWGGVGKTALANKLILDAATEIKFEKFITLSTKVGSSQGEVNIHSKRKSTDPLTIPSSESNTIFHTLLNKKNTTIAGSIKRVCIQIINAVKSIDDEIINFSECSDSELMDMALDSMQKQKMLVCIDNFEDIESPQIEAEDFEPDVIEEINKQYELFRDFFSRWLKIYATKVTNYSDGMSQILITTRGLGGGAVPFDVTHLSLDETFDVFLEKVSSRIVYPNTNESEKAGLSGEQHVLINTNRKEMIESFSKWTMRGEEGERIENVAHPMPTIASATDITNADDEIEDIRKIIDKWNPAGRLAREISIYCTSKTLGGLTPEEKKVIFALANKQHNESFSYMDIVSLSNHHFNPTEANQFLRDFFDRGFFQHSSHGAEKYRWKIEIQIQVRNDEDYEKPNIKRDVELSTKSSVYPPSELSKEYVDTEVRSKFFTWMNDGDDNRFSKPIEKNKNTFNFTLIMNKLNEEKNLTPRNLSSMYCALFDVDKGKQLELFPVYLKSMNKNLIDIFITYQTNFFKEAETSFGQITSKDRAKILTNRNKLRNKSKYGKLVEQAFIRSSHNDGVWNYVKYIFQNIMLILKEDGQADNVSKLVQISTNNIKNAHKCRLINDKEFLEFYLICIDGLTGLASHFDDEGISMRNADLIHEICNVLSPHPKRDTESDTYARNVAGISEDLRKPYEKVFTFYQEAFFHTPANIDLLQGYMFWIALRLAANTQIYDNKESDYEKYMNFVKDNRYYGELLVRSDINKNLISKYITQVGESQKQIIWGLNELHQNRRWGVLNKIVSFNPSKPSSIRVEVITDPELSNDVHKNLREDTYLYLVENNKGNIYYLSPILNSENKPIKSLEHWHEYNDLTKKVNDCFYKIKFETANNKVFSWIELLEEIDNKMGIKYSSYLLLGRKIGLDPQSEIKKFKEILSEENKGFLNLYYSVNNHLFIKFSKFNQQDKDKIQRYRYETENPKKSTQIVGSAQKKEGHSLPRNPAEFAKMINLFYLYKKKNFTVSYHEFLSDLRTNHGIKNWDMLYRFQLYLTAREFELDFNCHSREIINQKIPFGNYPMDIDKTTSFLEARILWTCKDRNNLNKITLDPKVVKDYFREVKEHLNLKWNN